MSRPTFLNPFARGAEKTGQRDGELDGACGLVATDASGSRSAVYAPGSRTEHGSDFYDDDLASALLSSRVGPRSFLPLGPTASTEPEPPLSQEIDTLSYAAGGSFSGQRSSDVPELSDSPEAARGSRKGSFSLRRHMWGSRPLLKRVVNYLRPAIPSAEVRRNELRDLLSQNSGPKPLCKTRPAGTPSRPPRPPSIEPGVLDLLNKYPSPGVLESRQHTEKGVAAIPGRHMQISVSSSNADLPPHPPPKAERVGGSLPALPLLRQKIGVAPDPRGRPRQRRATNAQPATHWDVLQVNRIRVPPPSEAKWLSAGVLGQGGFGTVYLVYNVRRREQCAMKVVHYAQGMSEVSCRGTINELKVLRRLALEIHPSPFLLQPFVCDELWAWRSAGQYLHIVTELCTGGDLSCYQYRLTDYNLALISAEVILGLEYLHRQGIVHHDIKPANILVNGAGHCVIGDYGGAQFLDTSGRISRSRRNMAVMTIPFAAPELLAENDSVFPTYDGAVDYWSLGATLVSLIMDDSCLPGSYDVAMITHRLHRIEKTMARIGASKKFQHFVMALLEIGPSQRPRFPEVAQLPFLQDLDWDAVKDLRCPPFDFVRNVGVLAHGFSIPTAQVHETRNPVDLLQRLRQEQLSLVVDESYNVEAHKATIAGHF